MKTLKWILLVVLVTGLGFSTIMLRTRPLDMYVNEATDANERDQVVERDQSEVYQPAPSATVAVRVLAPVIPLTPDKIDVPVADIASPPANMMQVRADQLLAKVNDRAILLADLVPLRADEQEKAMTAEEYESRLNRAIEMELTFQAATTQGVQLTPDQTRRVEGVARKHEATFREYTKQGITWSSLTATQLEFEQRLTAALMLQQNLVAKEAHVAPASDPSAQGRYEAARTAVLSRLRANSNIRVSTAEL